MNNWIGSMYINTSIKSIQKIALKRIIKYYFKLKWYRSFSKGIKVNVYVVFKIRVNILHKSTSVDNNIQSVNI